MAKSILKIENAEDARKFFMQSEQYHGFELPEYFVFDKVLDFVAQKVGDKPMDECIAGDDVAISDTNFEMLTNKDGKYAVRPLMLANPYLYWFLVRELTTENGWKATLDCFDKYSVPHITSCALPRVKDANEKEPFHHSTAILNWWNTMEQRSLELSLEYRYMFLTDITNCYGSINPDSIDWAMARKSTKYATDENHEMSANVKRYLRMLQGGRNIGIPQGSAIFDFIGEFILGYSDLLLHERLMKEGIDGYEIIRYRDDYRIFCNDKDTLIKISYILQQVLESLNLRLNSSKTKISENLVTDSIKSDKLWYIKNTPIFNKKGVDFDGIQKHLLFILMFGREFPNGGQLKVLLSDLDKRIIKKLKPRKVKMEAVAILDEDCVKDVSENPKEEIVEFPGKIYENMTVLAAVGTQIAVENVSVVHYVLRVISRLVDSMEDESAKWEIIGKVAAKLTERPNSDYDKIWLQNITYQRDKKAGVNPYSSVSLCRLVMKEDATIWNNSWLKPELTKGFPIASVCDNATLKKITPVITFRETRAYYDQ